MGMLGTLAQASATEAQVQDRQRMAKTPQQPWGARLDTAPCLDGPQQGTL